jgi:flagellar basal-body rod modification protein FlgD
MAVTTSAVHTTATDAASSVSKATSQISADAFLTLLAAELQHQDPLEPMDGEQMVAQLAQLSSVSELSKLNENFKNAQGVQMVAQVAGLVGHRVAWIDSTTGRTVAGTVDSVELSGNDWVLNVGDEQVGLDSILAIS